MDKKSTFKNQDILTRVACTFVFTLFTFFYLYYYQADLLTVMQHVFSKGQTHYNHFVGAVLITLVLLLVQAATVHLLKKVRMAWALTFVPSALCLILLTDVKPDELSGTLAFGTWVYLFPAALALFVLIIWGAEKAGLSLILSRRVHSTQICSLWINLLIVFVTVTMVCISGNSDKVYHARIHMEQCIMNGDYDGALKTSQQLDKSDENITMLTAYALSRNKELPESIFEYRLKGGSAALMPNGTCIKFELLPDSAFYSYMGNMYLQRMSTMKYLDYQKRHNRINSRTADYLLCGYLLDKNLNSFVNEITKYYAVNDSAALPKHYKEALLLYTHMHSNPRIIYSNNIMNADFQDFQKLERSTADIPERQTALRDTYGNTYWYYYQYGK